LKKEGPLSKKNVIFAVFILSGLLPDKNISGEKQLSNQTKNTKTLLLKPHKPIFSCQS